MRNRLIDAYKARFKSDPRVNALWLEGADGLGMADEYSDLDFWLDAQDGTGGQVLEDCIALAQSFGPLDGFDTVAHTKGDIVQANLHIAGTSDYLFIDLCVQSHSRCATGCCVYYEGDIAELPLVLFDKAGIIRLVPPPPLDWAQLGEIKSQADICFSQRSRMSKYIARREYLESLYYYEKVVLSPLITLARLIHTPRHPDYGWTHISRHLPEELRARFEMLARPQSLEDLSLLLTEADGLYRQLQMQWENMEINR